MSTEDSDSDVGLRQPCYRMPYTADWVAEQVRVGGDVVEATWKSATDGDWETEKGTMSPEEATPEGLGDYSAQTEGNIGVGTFAILLAPSLIYGVCWAL
jgi:hypothetical protein